MFGFHPATFQRGNFPVRLNHKCQSESYSGQNGSLNWPELQMRLVSRISEWGGYIHIAWIKVRKFTVHGTSMECALHPPHQFAPSGHCEMTRIKAQCEERNCKQCILRLWKTQGWSVECVLSMYLWASSADHWMMVKDSEKWLRCGSLSIVQAQWQRPAACWGSEAIWRGGWRNQEAAPASYWEHTLATMMNSPESPSHKKHLETRKHWTATWNHMKS